MSLVLLYFGTRYDVYEFDTLWDITIRLFYVTFDLHLWPSAFVKVTCTLIISLNVFYVVECLDLNQKWRL